MRKSAQIIGGAIVLLVLCFCIYIFVIKQENQPSVSVMDQIFQAQMIGATITQLEQTTGPAQSSWGNVNTYQVEGCELEVTHVNSSITAMALTVTPACTFDLQNILRQDKNKLMAHTLSFGDFSQSVGQSGVFYADCLEGCGNAFDPAVYLHWTGARSHDFVEVLLSSTDYGDVSALTQTMALVEGGDWVMNNQFNCNPYLYRDVMAMAFKDVVVQKVTLGYDLLESLEVSMGCQ